MGKCVLGIDKNKNTDMRIADFIVRCGVSFARILTLVSNLSMDDRSTHTLP